jgi:uncharacterized membrane protein HdeD (DUF308 family)
MTTVSTLVQQSLAGTARTFVARGALAIAFGLALLVWPGASLSVIVLTFGVFAIADGLVALRTSTSAPDGERGGLVLQGVAGIASGVIAFVWPGISAVATMYLIGAWAMVKGTVELAAAFRLPASGWHRFVLGLVGLVTIGFGIGVVVHPGAGAVALLTLIGLFAIATGVGMLAAGIELRRTKHDVRDLTESVQSPVAVG